MKHPTQNNIVDKTDRTKTVQKEILIIHLEETLLSKKKANYDAQLDLQIKKIEEPSSNRFKEKHFYLISPNQWGRTLSKFLTHNSHSEIILLSKYQFSLDSQKLFLDYLDISTSTLQNQITFLVQEKYSASFDEPIRPIPLDSLLLQIKNPNKILEQIMNVSIIQSNAKQYQYTYDINAMISDMAIITFKNTPETPFAFPNILSLFNDVTIALEHFKCLTNGLNHFFSDDLNHRINIEYIVKNFPSIRTLLCCNSELHILLSALQSLHLYTLQPPYRENFNHNDAFIEALNFYTKINVLRQEYETLKSEGLQPNNIEYLQKEALTPKTAASNSTALKYFFTSNGRPTEALKSIRSIEGLSLSINILKDSSPLEKETKITKKNNLSYLINTYNILQEYYSKHINSPLNRTDNSNLK